MYGWIHAHLPGPRWLRSMELLLLLVGVAALMWYVVYPWANDRLALNEVTVESLAPRPAPGGAGLSGAE